MANIAFTRIIHVTDHSLEFNFRKLPGENQHFHADVTDPRGNRIQFSMKRDELGSWQATGSLLPLWISNAAATIGEVIQEEMSMV